MQIVCFGGEPVFTWLIVLLENVFVVPYSDFVVSYVNNRQFQI